MCFGGSRRAATRPGTLGPVKQFAKVWNDQVDGDPTSNILTAWIAKEELCKLFALAPSGGHRHEVSARLHLFNAWCARTEARNRTVKTGARIAYGIRAWTANAARVRPRLYRQNAGPPPAEGLSFSSSKGRHRRGRGYRNAANYRARILLTSAARTAA